MWQVQTHGNVREEIRLSCRAAEHPALTTERAV